MQSECACRYGTLLVAIFFAAPSVAALITARKVFDFVKEKRQAKRAAKRDQEFQEQDRSQDGDQDQRQGSGTSTEDCAASPEPVIMLRLARVGFGTRVSTL